MMRCVTLGSRKNLCVHQGVLKLKNLNYINDKCVDLQRSSTGCPYLDRESNQLQEFADQAHAVMHDIEELHKLGLKNKTCSYYGTRHAIQDAQVLCVPYNLLIQKAARESMGIQLQDCIVLIGSFDSAR